MKEGQTAARVLDLHSCWVFDILLFDGEQGDCRQPRCKGDLKDGTFVARPETP